MKTSKSKIAIHRSIANQKVSFTLVKDFLGDTLYKVRFSSGETTTMPEYRFNEIFEIVKN